MAPLGFFFATVVLASAVTAGLAGAGRGTSSTLPVWRLPDGLPRWALGLLCLWRCTSWKPVLCSAAAVVQPSPLQPSWLRGPLLPAAEARSESSRICAEDCVERGLRALATSSSSCHTTPQVSQQRTGGSWLYCNCNTGHACRAQPSTHYTAAYMRGGCGETEQLALTSCRGAASRASSSSTCPAGMRGDDVVERGLSACSTSSCYTTPQFWHNPVYVTKPAWELIQEPNIH